MVSGLFFFFFSASLNQIQTQVDEQQLLALNQMLPLGPPLDDIKTFKKNTVKRKNSNRGDFTWTWTWVNECNG